MGLERLHRYGQELLKLVTAEHYISGTVGLLVAVMGLEEWSEKYTAQTFQANEKPWSGKADSAVPGFSAGEYQPSGTPGIRQGGRVDEGHEGSVRFVRKKG